MKKSSKDILIASGILFILLLLGGVVYFWVLDHPTYKHAPEIIATCERYNDDYVIVLESVEFGASVKSMKYSVAENQIAVEDYSNYSSSNGLCANYVDEIYDVDLMFQNEDKNPISNVSFYDNDLDGKVSAGDIFVIRGINNSDIYNNKGERVPGVGRDGLVLNLKFNPTDETICSITLSDTSHMTNKMIPKISNRFTINPATVPKTPNINISTSMPVFSARPSLRGNSIIMATTIHNNDSVNVSNISVRFFDDGESFYSEEKISIEAGDELRVLASPYYLLETGTHNITVEVMIPEWDLPIQANATVTVICAAPCVSSSFEVNSFTFLLTVLVISLLSTIPRKRKV